MEGFIKELTISGIEAFFNGIFQGILIFAPYIIGVGTFFAIGWIIKRVIFKVWRQP